MSKALSDRYVIERELGAGGMATVYLATDLKHDRQVALKVIRSEVTSTVGADRFLAEIRTTAKLQHPHILSLFDSGDADGVLYYVMPYIEGESLRGRLDRETQLPVDEAVTIAREVADALHFAHKQGVIHRDIKPGNILIKDGRAFVADFGIALAVREAESSRLTEVGTRVGTPLYMSPEQAAGDGPVDARTDIYSVACVLHEMLAGAPPFTGSTAQQVLTKIVFDRPRPLREIRNAVPENVEAAVGMGLEKLPADRFRDADAFGRALADAGFRTGAPTGVAARVDAALWRRRAVLALMTTVVLLIAAAWGWLRPMEAGSNGGLLRAMVETAPGPMGLALSPDGRTVAYTALDDDGTRWLWVQPLDAAMGRPLEGTEGAEDPFWSPDGQDLGFFADGSLKRIPVAGGAVTTLARAETPTGGAWGPDGRIVYSPIYSGGLLEISEDGGQPRVLTELNTELGEKSHRWPQFLPGGRDLIFLAQTAEYGAQDDRSRIDVLDAEGQRHEVVMVNSSAAFADGRLLYWRAGSLYAHVLDVEGRRAVGTPRLVVGGVAFDGSERADFSAAPGGTLVYRAADPPWRLEWRDRTGRLVAVEASDGSFNSHELSMDGERVAFLEGPTLWVRDLGRGTQTRLTFEDDDHRSPTWSPDGEWIAFTADRTEGLGGDIYRIRSAGGEPEHLLGHDTETFRELRWSDDGGSIVYMMTDDLYVFDFASLEARLAVATPGRDLDGSLSPNGRWLAFSSDESGRREVYVARASQSAQRWPISRRGGSQPVWSASGEDLYFFGLDYELRVVSIGSGPTPDVGVPEPLFAVTSPGTGHRFQIAPDGRVLLRTHDASASHQNPRLILGWPELVR